MSSENNHYSMKDPTEWSHADWDEHRRCQEQNQLTPLEYGECQPDWDEKYGSCTQLMYRVLEEQKGAINVSAFDFMYLIQEFTIQVVVHKVPCTLDQAYEVAGYDMTKHCKNCGTQLSIDYGDAEPDVKNFFSINAMFCSFGCSEENLLNNTEPVPF